jgi:hypothetical protein
MSIRLFNSAGGYIDLESGGNSSTANVFTFPAASGTIDRLNRAGNVLQVVQNTYTTPTTVASTSYTDTGLTASITPTSASSKILVIVTQGVTHYQNTNNARLFELRLLRDATEISNRDAYCYAAIGSNGFVEGSIDGSQMVLDNPATTSSITYKTQGKVDSTANATAIVFQQGSGTSTITLMEIAA